MCDVIVPAFGGFISLSVRNFFIGKGYAVLINVAFVG